MRVYKYGSPPKWGANVNYRDAQRKKRGFRTRQEAEAWAINTLEELKRLYEHSIPVGTEITVADLAIRWREYKSKRVRVSTLEDYDKYLRRIISSFGTRKIRSISTLELQRFIDRQPSPRQANKTRVVLSGMFRAAVTWGLAYRDPTRGLTGVREPQRHIRVLTPQEADKLLRNLEGQYRIFVNLALSTGMRCGELCALRWGDVMEGGIEVRASRTRGREGEPKGGRVRRVVIPNSLYRLLCEYRMSCGNPPDTDYLFILHGKPLENWNVRDALATACKRAGIERVRPHDLRHTYAAWCLTGGVNPKFVQQQLGHSTISVTMDIYGHLLPSAEEEYRIWAEQKIGNISETVNRLGKLRKDAKVAYFPPKTPAQGANK